MIAAPIETSRSAIWLLCLSLVMSAFLPGSVRADEPAAATSLVVESLLRDTIQGVEGKEIIVSRVSFPPHTQLPWHWHPGEEVFYVIEGSVTLKRRGQPDVLAAAGDAQKIAPKVVHTGETGEVGAELVIFRVHTAGEPERHLVESF
jgi:quercetin dioxygenase-like cupin family protein